MPLRKRVKNDKGAAPPEIEGDRISALPDELLKHVLSFLPAKEAVHTCVLARRWRPLWKSATGLRLSCIESTPRKEFQLFVDHLLLLRGTAPLDTFELVFDRSRDRYERLCLNIWIRHVLMCQVRTLMLYNMYFNGFGLDDLPLISQHLTRLELIGVTLKNSFCNFLGCPSLEHLEIAYCLFQDVKELSSKSLKRLSIKNCCFSVNILICVPSLVSLCLDGHLYSVSVLESMPSLQVAFIRNANAPWDCYDDCDPYDGIAHDNTKCFLLEGLSQAKSLTLISVSEMFIFRRDLKHCPTFSKLKTLLLNDSWCVAPDFHALTSILKHSPVLEKLTLHLFSKGPKHEVEIIGRCNPMERSATISEHLKAIEVKCKVIDENVHKV
uniref:F-box domain-containing protein n=1 Tax=Arundo donax TaxID=35708 RepID=A0A0A9G8R3_ARUDO